MPGENPSDLELFAQRMKRVSDSIGGAKMLSEKTGIPRRTIGTYLAAEAEPTLNKLVTIAKTTEVNIAWLATGEGPMRELEAAHHQVSMGMATALTDFSIPKKYAFAPSCWYSLPAEKLEEYKEFMVFRRRYIENELAADPSNLCFMYYDDNSMHPTIRTNDVLLIDTSDVDVEKSGIYFMFLDRVAMIRRIKRIKGSDWQIRYEILCDNESMQEEKKRIFLTGNIKDAKNISIIGRVVWFGRKMA